MPPKTEAQEPRPGPRGRLGGPNPGLGVGWSHSDEWVGWLSRAVWMHGTAEHTSHFTDRLAPLCPCTCASHLKLPQGLSRREQVRFCNGEHQIEAVLRPARTGTLSWGGGGGRVCGCGCGLMPWATCRQAGLDEGRGWEDTPRAGRQALVADRNSRSIWSEPSCSPAVSNLLSAKPPAWGERLRVGVNFYARLSTNF